MTPDDKRHHWSHALHIHGLGESDVQEALIAALSGMVRPLTADEIWGAVQQRRPETGRATVYRFINRLTDAGLLRRVHGYRGCNTYMPTLNDDEPLLLCTACGQVSPLGPDQIASVSEAFQRARQALRGHHVTGYQLQLFEVCITCQPKIG